MARHTLGGNVICILEVIHLFFWLVRARGLVTFLVWIICMMGLICHLKKFIMRDF